MKLRINSAGGKGLSYGWVENTGCFKLKQLINYRLFHEKV